MDQIKYSVQDVLQAICVPPFLRLRNLHIFQTYADETAQPPHKLYFCLFSRSGLLYTITFLDLYK